MEPGRAAVCFLKRQYKESIDALEKVAEIDPEDLQMHYTAMLAYRGLGDGEKAAREQKLFQRFKAEESSQSITAKRRLISPEDNNERQSIHDHESIGLGPAPAPSRETPSTKSAACMLKPAGKSTGGNTAGNWTENEIGLGTDRRRGSRRRRSAGCRSSGL